MALSHLPLFKHTFSSPVVDCGNPSFSLIHPLFGAFPSFHRCYIDPEPPPPFFSLLFLFAVCDASPSPLAPRTAQKGLFSPSACFFAVSCRPKRTYFSQVACHDPFFSPFELRIALVGTSSPLPDFPPWLTCSKQVVRFFSFSRIFFFSPCGIRCPLPPPFPFPLYKLFDSPFSRGWVSSQFLFFYSPRLTSFFLFGPFSFSPFLARRLRAESLLREFFFPSNLFIRNVFSPFA